MNALTNKKEAFYMNIGKQILALRKIEYYI